MSNRCDTTHSSCSPPPPASSLATTNATTASSPRSLVPRPLGARLPHRRTRLTPDFIPKVRISHYLYAALLWVAILAFWHWKTRRELRLPIYEEGKIKSRCPRRRKQAR